MCEHSWIKTSFGQACVICGASVTQDMGLSFNQVPEPEFNGDFIEKFLGLKDFTHTINKYKLDIETLRKR